VRSTTLRIESDDADEAVYDIALSGIGTDTAPEINLHDGALTGDPSIVNGGLADLFGGTLVLGGAIDRTFNIDNSAGSAPLTIGAVVVAGHVADFSTLGAVPSTIPAGASGTFVLRFDPTAAGSRSATVIIFSDDADESAYVFHVSGRGQEGPFLLCEDFEDDGNGSRYLLSTQFFDLTNGIMDQTTNLTHAEEGDYTGPVNKGIFAAEDTDDAAGNSQAKQTLTFTVPIVGANNLVFSGLFAVGASSTYDPDDQMLVQASIDGAPLQTLLQFESTSSGVGNQPLALDSDFNGQGDGSVLGLHFQEFSAPILGSGATLILTVTIQADSRNESMALDYLKIASVPDNVYQAYDQWTHDAGLVGDDASFLDDPDGDGGKNGYEWATGSIPSNANSIVRLDIGSTNAHQQVLFTRNTDATELTLTVQCTTDLTDTNAWTGVATNVLGVWTPPAVVSESGSGNPVDVNVSVGLTNASAAFYRLHVSQP
jgi:hypothetical protein